MRHPPSAVYGKPCAADFDYKIITQKNNNYRNFQHTTRKITYNITKIDYKKVLRLTLTLLCIIFIITQYPIALFCGTTILLKNARIIPSYYLSLFR